MPWGSKSSVSSKSWVLGIKILIENPTNRRAIDTFALQNVLCSGFQGILFKGGNKWLFPEYKVIKTTFEKVKKENRDKIYDSFVKELFSCK